MDALGSLRPRYLSRHKVQVGLLRRSLVSRCSRNQRWNEGKGEKRKEKKKRTGNRRRCGSNNHFIKKEKASKASRDTRPRRKIRRPRTRRKEKTRVPATDDISKRTGNCVLSISETTELNAATDVDLIVATPISKRAHRIGMGKGGRGGGENELYVTRYRLRTARAVV